MKIEVDTDFAIPILVALMSILFVVGYQTLVPRSAIDYWVQENGVLFQELANSERKNVVLTKEVEKYHVTEESLKRLGATTLTAQRVIMASEVYGIDPKPMGAL